MDGKLSDSTPKALKFISIFVIESVSIGLVEALSFDGLQKIKFCTTINERIDNLSIVPTFETW
jgi:hypothetical protein